MSHAGVCRPEWPRHRKDNWDPSATATGSYPVPPARGYLRASAPPQVQGTVMGGVLTSGVRVGAERVRRSLLRQRLRSVYRRPYRVTTDSNHRKPVAQNLLNRRFFGWPADRAWTTDIMYLARRAPLTPLRFLVAQSHFFSRAVGSLTAP